MRIEQLYYLTEVVKANSISRAAEKIFVTQQTISQSLLNLERELGVKLLIRTHKGITLTAQGKIFHDQACQVLKSFGDLKTSFWQAEDPALTATLGGSLTLYCSTVLSSHYVAPIIRCMLRKYPQAHIRLFEENNFNLLPQIIGQPNSIGVLSVVAEYFNDVLRDEYKNALWYETLFLDELMACVSTKSPLAKQSALSLPELLQQPLALCLNNEHNFHSLKQFLPPEATLAPNILLLTADHLWIRQMVEDNRAVSILPLKMYQHQPHPDFVLLPFKENIHLAYLIVKNSQHDHTPLENLFIQELRHLFAELSAAD